MINQSYALLLVHPGVLVTAVTLHACISPTELSLGRVLDDWLSNNLSVQFGSQLVGGPLVMRSPSACYRGNSSCCRETYRLSRRDPATRGQPDLTHSQQVTVED